MNSDQLTIGLAFFFALLLLVAIGGLIYLGSYLIRERHKKTWRFFAAANNLTFKLGSFPQVAHVNGTLSGYRLSLRSKGKLTQMTLVREMTTEPAILQDHEATVTTLIKLLAIIYHIDLDRMQKLEPFFKTLTQKITKVYGVDPWPLYQKVLKNSLLLPEKSGPLSISSKSGSGDNPNNFQQSMENTLTASHIKGNFTLENAGRLVSYRQASLETDPDYLQAILRLLTDIAEAYPAMIDLGMDSVPFLSETASPENTLSLVVRQLIEDIAAETRRRLGQAPDHFLCLRCLTHCIEHSLTLPDRHDITYYGCRTCRQSRTFFEGEAIMLLNRHYSATEPIQQDGKLRVNWFIERTLFDFDKVEILSADDEAVEYFALQVSHDTDPVRQPRYKEMPCLIASDCELLDNSVQILERTFGEVTRS